MQSCNSSTHEQASIHSKTNSESFSMDSIISNYSSPEAFLKYIEKEALSALFDTEKLHNEILIYNKLNKIPLKAPEIALHFFHIFPFFSEKRTESTEPQHKVTSKEEQKAIDDFFNLLKTHSIFPQEQCYKNNVIFITHLYSKLLQEELDIPTLKEELSVFFSRHSLDETTTITIQASPLSQCEYKKNIGPGGKYLSGEFILGSPEQKIDEYYLILLYTSISDVLACNDSQPSFELRQKLFSQRMTTIINQMDFSRKSQSSNEEIIKREVLAFLSQNHMGDISKNLHFSFNPPVFTEEDSFNREIFHDSFKFSFNEKGQICGGTVFLLQPPTINSHRNSFINAMYLKTEQLCKLTEKVKYLSYCIGNDPSLPKLDNIPTSLTKFITYLKSLKTSCEIKSAIYGFFHKHGIENIFITKIDTSISKGKYSGYFLKSYIVEGNKRTLRRCYELAIPDTLENKEAFILIHEIQHALNEFYHLLKAEKALRFSLTEEKKVENAIESFYEKIISYSDTLNDLYDNSNFLENIILVLLSNQLYDLKSKFFPSFFPWIKKESSTEYFNKFKKKLCAYFYDEIRAYLKSAFTLKNDYDESTSNSLYSTYRILLKTVKIIRNIELDKYGKLYLNKQ